jgi:hypothetical protein
MPRKLYSPRALQEAQNFYLRRGRRGDLIRSIALSRASLGMPLNQAQAFLVDDAMKQQMTSTPSVVKVASRGRVVRVR